MTAVLKAVDEARRLAACELLRSAMFGAHGQLAVGATMCAATAFQGVWLGCARYLHRRDVHLVALDVLDDLRLHSLPSLVAKCDDTTPYAPKSSASIDSQEDRGR